MKTKVLNDSKKSIRTTVLFIVAAFLAFLLLSQEHTYASLPNVTFRPDFPVLTYKITEGNREHVVDVGILSEESALQLVNHGILRQDQLDAVRFYHRCVVLDHLNGSIVQEEGVVIRAILLHANYSYMTYYLNPHYPSASKAYLSEDKINLELDQFGSFFLDVIKRTRDFVANLAGGLAVMVLTGGQSAVLTAAELKREITEESAVMLLSFLSQNALKRGQDYYRAEYQRQIKRNIDALGEMIQYLDTIIADPSHIPTEEEIDQLISLKMIAASCPHDSAYHEFLYRASVESQFEDILGNFSEGAGKETIMCFLESGLEKFMVDQLRNASNLIEVNEIMNFELTKRTLLLAAAKASTDGPDIIRKMAPEVDIPAEVIAQQERIATKISSYIDDENNIIASIMPFSQLLLKALTRPRGVNDFLGQQIAEGIELSWYAPRDDMGEGGRVGSYLVRWSNFSFGGCYTNEDDVWNWGQVLDIPLPEPAEPGQLQSVSVFGLQGIEPGKRVYFSIQSVDREHGGGALDHAGIREYYSKPEFCSAIWGGSKSDISLMAVMVFPSFGDTSTDEYSYSCLYRHVHGIQPDLGYPRLFVDGALIGPMGGGGSDPGTGSFYYQTINGKLSKGTHTFHVEVAAGSATKTTAEIPFAVGNFLAGGLVSPENLNELGNATYHVNWRHPHGKLPGKTFLYRRNGPGSAAFQPFVMNLVSGGAVQGAVYERNLGVWAGDTWSNEFYFAFECGEETYRDPETGYHSGPTVAKFDDFKVESVELQPAQPLGGQNATVKVRIRNAGSVSRVGADVSLLIDSAQVGDTYHSGGVFAGSYDDCAFSWNIPIEQTEQAYHVEAQVSYAGDSDPSNDRKGFYVTIQPPPGSISGYARDEYAQVVEGAEVKVIDGPAQAAFWTDERGYFLLDGLKPGNYDLLASKSDVGKCTHLNIAVSAGQNTPQDFELQARSYTELYTPSTALDSDQVQQIAWSYNGQKLVFQLFREENYEIWVMNGDGSGLTQVAGQGKGIYRGKYPSCSRISDRFSFWGEWKDAQNNTRSSLFVFRLSNLSNYEGRIDDGYARSAWYPGEDVILYESVKYHSPGDVVKYNCSSGNTSILLEGVWGQSRLQISPDGTKLICSRNIYNAQSGTLISENYVPSGRGVSWLPDSSGVIYDDYEDIWAWGFDGVSCKFIDSPNANIYPALSPDGSMLAFSSTEGFSPDGDHAGLWTVPFDMRGLFLAGLQLAPETHFSPNGDGLDDATTITFHLSKQALATVRVLDSTGKSVRTLWDDNLSLPGDHSLLWDGLDDNGLLAPNQVYYITVNARDSEGNDAVPQKARIGIIQSFGLFPKTGYVSPDMAKLAYVSVNGKELRLRYPSTGAEALLATAYEVAASYYDCMSWDFNSGKLAFIARPMESQPQVSIGVVDISDTSTLAFVVNPLGHDLKTIHGPSWSPDGSKIAFAATWEPAPTYEAHEDVFVCDSDGANRVRITNLPVNQYEIYSKPVWTRDSQYLIYCANDHVGSNVDLYKARISDGTVQRITNHPYDDKLPLLSPDGFQLIYASSKMSYPDPGDTWITYLDGSQDVCQVKYRGTIQVSRDGFFLCNDGSFVELRDSISRGTIKGRVLEIKGDEKQGIAAAGITVLSGTDEIAFGVSNAEGYFSVSNVELGDYTLRYSKTGYKPLEQPSGTVQPNKTRMVADVTLAKLPEVALVEPNADGKRYLEKAPVAAWETTKDVAEVRFEIREDGATSWTSLGVDNAAPFEMVVEGLPVAAGEEKCFQLRATARNMAEESDDCPSTISLIIDKRAPHAEIVIPVDGSSLSVDSRVILQATTTDSDIRDVLFQYRPEGTDTWHNIGTAQVKPFMVVWETLGLPLKYELRAVATDEVGNMDPAPGVVTVTTGRVSGSPKAWSLYE